MTDINYLLPFNLTEYYLDSGNFKVFGVVDSNLAQVALLNKDFLDKSTLVIEDGILKVDLKSEFNPEFDGLSPIVSFPSLDDNNNAITWTIEQRHKHNQADPVVINSASGNAPYVLVGNKGPGTVDYLKTSTFEIIGRVADSFGGVPNLTTLSDSDKYDGERYLQFNLTMSSEGIYVNDVNYKEGLKYLNMTIPTVKYRYSKEFIDANGRDFDFDPAGMTWSADGQYLYVIDASGLNNNIVKQFYTGGDSFDILNFDPETPINEFPIYRFQTRDPVKLEFQKDGRKMFLAGADNNHIIQYDLTTPWDLSTMSYDVSYIQNEYFNRDIFVTDDGSRLYTLNDSNHILGFDLDSNYYVNTGLETDSAHTQFIKYPGSDNMGLQPGAFIIPEAAYYQTTSKRGRRSYDESLMGARLYVRCFYGCTYNTYFDHTTNIESFCFSSNGQYLYTITGIALNKGLISRWTLSTPWDVSTATSELAINHQIGVAADNYIIVQNKRNGATGIRINPDGSELYILNNANGIIYKYTFITNNNYNLQQLNGLDIVQGDRYTPTTYTLGTTGADQTLNTGLANAHGLDIDWTNNKIYVTDKTKVYQYTMPSAGDLANATLTRSESLLVGSETEAVCGKTGRLYLQEDKVVYQYDMTGTDISSTTVRIGFTDKYYPLNTSLTDSIGTVAGLFLSQDDKTFYTFDNQFKQVNKFQLSDSDLISSANPIDSAYSLPNITSNTYHGLELNLDEDRMYIGAKNAVYQFTVDPILKNSSFDQVTHVLVGSTKDARDIRFNNDGVIFFALGVGGPAVDGYQTDYAFSIENV